MSSDLRAELQRLTRQHHERVIEWRRAIHAWPELVYQEHRTAALAVLAGSCLRALGAW